MPIATACQKPAALFCRMEVARVQSSRKPGERAEAEVLAARRAGELRRLVPGEGGVGAVQHGVVDGGAAQHQAFLVGGQPDFIARVAGGVFCSRPVPETVLEAWRWRAYSHEAYQQYSPSSLPAERRSNASLRGCALRVVALAAGGWRRAAGRRGC